MGSSRSSAVLRCCCAPLLLVCLTGCGQASAPPTPHRAPRVTIDVPSSSDAIEGRAGVRPGDRRALVVSLVAVDDDGLPALPGSPLRIRGEVRKDGRYAVPVPPVEAGQFDVRVTQRDARGAEGVAVANVELRGPDFVVDPPMGRVSSSGELRVTGTALSGAYDALEVRLELLDGKRQVGRPVVVRRTFAGRWSALLRLPPELRREARLVIFGQQLSEGGQLAEDETDIDVRAGAINP